VAIDPQAPKTIWAGTGEAWTRNSVSIGNGVYKSTDGGDSWTNMGLPNSERIAKIIIDPKNGNTVYVCVPGNSGATAKTAACTKRQMAEKPGTRS